MFKFRIFIIITFCLRTALEAQVPPQLTATYKNKIEGYFFLTLMKPSAAASNTNAAYFNLILDGKGEIIYFSRFAGNFKVCDFKLQPNGRMSYFQKNKFYLLDSSFHIVDTITCLNNIQTDNHELLMSATGKISMIGTETVSMNLQPYKVFNHLRSAGSQTAMVICGVIQEQDINGNVLFEWHSKDHLDFMDVDTSFLSDPTKVDWTHINSLFQDKDSNYIISVRHFNEVIKINRQNGSILWRLGGKKNEFKFVNDTIDFKGQHDVRKISNGNLTLFNNGDQTGKQIPASAREYLLNEKQKTAKLIWSHSIKPPSSSAKGLGNVQRLSNKNTLINYGYNNNTDVVFEILNTTENSVMNVTSADTLKTYRVYYYHRLPFNLPDCKILLIKKEGKFYLEAALGFSNYIWSNGVKSRTTEITDSGEYFVWINAGYGFIRSKKFIVSKQQLH